MATLKITAMRFKHPFNVINGVTNPTISTKRCIKYATVVGNSHYSRAFSRTKTALALAAYRAMAVRCVIDFGHPELRARAEYSNLEPSEKVNLSFWIRDDIRGDCGRRRAWGSEAHACPQTTWASQVKKDKEPS